MTSSWEKATRIVGAARELEEPERTLFLRQACASDDELRSHVDTLLQDTPPASFLEQPAWTAIFDAHGTAPTRLEAGHVLKDRFRIESDVASGGQATVYLAQDERLNRPVIVKVARGAGIINPLLRARFEKEMKALSRIDHPAVVGILDVGELADGSPFLVINYVNGVTLREALANGPLDAAGSLNVLRQLAAALDAAHAAGVVHGDLKPENVMLQDGPDGGRLVKLIDFGIAKIERAEVEVGLTTVMVAGTVRYMAPEQFGGTNVAASDIYAFGLMACELLCGIPDVRSVRKRFSGPVAEIIDGALAYRPEERPSTASAFVDQIAARLATRSHRRRNALIATGAAVLIAGSFALGSQFHDNGPQSRVVEKVGAFDPVEEGFEIHNELTGTVVSNTAGDAYQAWQVTSPRMGHYRQWLTAKQKRRAIANGWILSARMRVDSGQVFAGIDISALGRFTINLYQEGDRDLVRLQTQIVPVFQGLDLQIPHDRAYHLYELRFDPGLGSADLWIDGDHRLTGYRGFTQFQGDGDVIFGAAAHKQARGAGAFQSVRFEILP